MTTVFVDLVNLDGSRPEGSLRFSLERLVLGDPDVVPSAVEVKIRDGKARVDDLLPGAMRVRVNAGCWSKDWQVTIPAEGEHDLLKLLEWQADDFQETVWAELNRRVEKLENTPAVDLAPVEQRLDALEGVPVVDLAPLEDATRDLGSRVTALEQKPDPEPFDPAELQAQLAAMQAKLNTLPNFTPVDLLDGNYESIDWDSLSPIYEVGGSITASLWMGRVNITIGAPIADYSIPVFEEGLSLVGFPTPINGNVTARVWLESPTAYRPTPGGYLYIKWVDGKLSITDRTQGEMGEGNLRQALEDGYTQTRIEIEYFTTDTN
ncbi:hypothetical protein [Corynebacterium amycolatum]|uniref:hypothetical protein n=1 Tax=Corynebacterium amycolatum TaxID=43765 RepID=UPI00234C2C33|nr:hypothetical protein [Corynebacterium amycolatum]MDC7116171.1 hypothetical protein [Corynebacterium amycolatum]